MAGRINTILGLNTTEFQRGLVQATAKLDAFAKRAQSMGQTLTQNLTLPIVAVGAASVRSFADLEKLNKGLTAIMGSSEAAGAEFEKLREVAKLPGLGLKEAVQGSINLQAVGLSADEARNTLFGFGKALAATGKGAVELEAIQYQLTQMISKNKLLAEDYKVIQSNLPLMAAGLEKAFGTNNIELIRATGISAKDFTLRLSEALTQLPQTQNATGGLANAFENFSDNVFIAGAALGESIAKSLDLENVLAKLSDGIAAVVDWFTQLSPATQKTIVVVAAFAAALGPVLFIVGKLAGAMPILAQGLKVVASAFGLLTSPVTLTVLAIAGAVVIVAKLYNEFEGVRRVINGVGNGFVELAKLAKQSFANILAGINAVKEGDFKGAAEAFSKALVIVNPAELGKTFAVGFSQGFADTRNYLKPTIEGIKKDIQAATKGIMTATGLGGGVSPISAGVGGGVQSDEETATRTAPIANFTQLENNIPLVQRFGAEIEALAEKNSGLTASFDELGVKLNTSAGAGLTSFGERIQRVREGLVSFSEGLTSIIEGVLQDAAVAFGNFIGDSLMGNFATGRNFFASLLQSIASALEQVGKLAIATGVAMLGIEAALKGLGAPGAIIAGVALVALSRLVKAKAASLAKFADGGIVYGPTPALVGEYPGARTNPEVIAPLSKLKDLIGGGGGYIAETRISGSDLLILVSNAERRNNRIR